MTDERERRYDSFVVRLWRGFVSPCVLRAEVEHVQTGERLSRRWSTIDAATGGALEEAASIEGVLTWVGEQLDRSASTRPP
jgi:hypothetical protein